MGKTPQSRYVGLLRGINVGGHKSVSMAALREFLEQLGFTHVKTLLQSGNVVFSAPKEPTEKLEKRLESAARQALDVEADFMIRTTDEWAKIVDANPFAQMAKDDPSHLVAMCLKSKPGNDAVTKLRSAIKGREEVELLGRELYATYVDGIGTSKLTNTVIEKTLGVRGTGRNWNTVLKIQAALSEAQ